MTRLAGFGLAIALLFALVPVATVGAATTTDFEHRVLDQINAARVSRGLVVLRTDGRLWDLAGDRAAAMASHNVLSHTVAGSLITSLIRRGIARYSEGETIGWTTGRGSAAADALVRMWRNSPMHWAILMSNRYNYLGVGLAYRSSNGRTFGSVVMTESPDHSGPRATVTGDSLTGNAILWTWTGGDVSLQTHTAGLLNYTIQIRRGTGAWVPVLWNTTATARITPNLAHGNWYTLRVRGKDRVGNIGAWSTRRIWVP
jgi:hypothetical protein